METSDGNQNINEVRYTTQIKDMVSHLWIIFFEMKKRVALQKEQNADDNLQCSNGDGQLKSRVDELEIQVSFIFIDKSVRFLTIANFLS